MSKLANAGLRRPARRFALTCFVAFGIGSTEALADGLTNPAPLPSAPNSPVTASSEGVPLAPIGVFGANQPHGGELVLSETSAYARTDGNLIGTTSVSPYYIINNTLSDRTPLAGYHLLRVVPLNGQSFGEFGSAAYGFTDRFALVASVGYLIKDKDLETFKGSTGMTVLGNSTPFTRGISDTTLAGLYRIYQGPMSAITLSMGMTFPTGDYSASWVPLSPAGAFQSKVAVYGMQLGSGSVSLLPGIAYTGFLRQWAWGLSYRASLPLYDNSDGWRNGNLQTASAWAGYSWVPGFMTTLRVGGTTQGQIRGSSAAILGYAEGNVPQFAGGKLIDVSLGATVSGSFIGLPKLVIQAEAGVPVYQSLNGPQAAAQWSGVVKVQYRF